MTVADDLLAEFGAELDAWDREYAHDLLASSDQLPAHLREAQVLLAATWPVVGPMTQLGPGELPGQDLVEDAQWAARTARARRQVLAHRAAGLDHGIGDRNVQLIDRVSSLIGTWREPEWTEAVRGNIERMIEACRSGRRRGEQMRLARDSQEPSPPPEVGWLLRHPGDYYLLSARARIADPWICAHLDAHALEFAPSYDALSGQDWSAEERAADLVVELRMPDHVPLGWTEPVSGSVVDVHRGEAQVGSEVPVRLVADPDAPFNGKLVSFLAREHWLICGRRLDDGTVVPDDGSRRLHRHNAPAGPSGPLFSPFPA